MITKEFTSFYLYILFPPLNFYGCIIFVLSDHIANT